MPLAIELAAARVRFLTPGAIHERLEGRLDLPGGGSMDVPERQRSLRGAIAWSYDLLDPPACLLFERLSVFMGGLDLAAAEAIGAGSTGDPDPIETLSALVDQSLLQSGEADGEPRFSFLEPIREFALERLEASGEAEAARERHARWYLAVARSVERDLTGDHQRAALDRLEREHANLRAAITLGRRAWRRGGRARRRDQHLAAVAEAGPPRRGEDADGGAVRRAVVRLGATAPARAGERGAGRHPLLARRLSGRPWSVRGRAGSLAGGGRPSRDRERVVQPLVQLCDEPRSRTRPGSLRAAALLDEALGLYRELGDRRGQANALWGIGIRHYFRNENELAAEALEQALVLARDVGDRTLEAWARHQLGSTRIKLGDLEAARSHLHTGLRLFDAAGDVAGVTLGLDDLASLAVAQDDLPRAARLQGLARRLQAVSGTGLAGFVDDAFEQATRPNVANRLSPGDLGRYRGEGATLSLEDGVRYALGDATWEELVP